MSYSITTNEWTDARRKPPIGRDVLAKFADGHKAVAKWNGMYWVGQHGMHFTLGDDIVRYYMYDMDPEDKVKQ